ncbi:MAG: N-acetyltransferase [Mariprofundaceae bacterium]|nr:N-acetyltransferase [Mariprofundaceae bacterium]
MKHLICIRKANTQDIPAMLALLNRFAPDELLLPRSEDDLLQHLQEFIVATHENDLLGISALHIYTSNLAEIRSLAVNPDYQKLGIGKLLIEACEKLAVELGIASLFALTYVSIFFEKVGYHVVKKESLPHKIWTVCIHCKKFAHCDEIAVQKRLSDAPIKPIQLAIVERVSEAPEFDSM